MAELPGPGTGRDEAIAALAGVAPYNRDSGPVPGQRHLAGGRAPVRCPRDLATLSAVRHDRILKAYYDQLRSRGKKSLVAWVACMRKLLLLMDRLLKTPSFSLAG